MFSSTLSQCFLLAAIGIFTTSVQIICQNGLDQYDFLFSRQLLSSDFSARQQYLCPQWGWLGMQHSILVVLDFDNWSANPQISPVDCTKKQ